jgi:hypothetical protein
MILTELPISSDCARTRFIRPMLSNRPTSEGRHTSIHLAMWMAPVLAQRMTDYKQAS